MPQCESKFLRHVNSQTPEIFCQQMEIEEENAQLKREIEALRKEKREKAEAESQLAKKSLPVKELTEDEMQAIQRELMEFGKASRIPVKLQAEIEKRELEELKAAAKKRDEANSSCDRNVRVVGPPSQQKGMHGYVAMN